VFTPLSGGDQENMGLFKSTVETTIYNFTEISQGDSKRGLKVRVTELSFVDHLYKSTFTRVR
jgi:hypothetical protein